MKQKMAECEKKIAEAKSQLAEGKLDVDAALKIIEAEKAKMAAMKKAEGGDETKTKADEDESESEDEAKAKADEDDEAEAGYEGEDDKPGDAHADGDDDEDEEKGDGGTTHVHIKHEEKMTKQEAVAALRRANALLEGSRKKLAEQGKALTEAQRKIAAAKVAKELAEAGVEGIDAADLAALPSAQRRVMVKVLKNITESGFGFGGNSPRGGAGHHSGVDGFMKLVAGSRN